VNRLKKKRKKSRLKDIWRRLRKNKLAVAGLIVMVLLILTAIFAQVIAPYYYSLQDSTKSYGSPTGDNLLGTDKLGRDLLSRLIYGARASLIMGFISVSISAVLGITIGSIAGFFGGWVDNISMRFLDIYQAIPMLLLCVTLAAILGPSLRNAIIALGVCHVPSFARLMRASVLTVREKEFIESARAVNATDTRIIIKHIIPNAIAPLIVEITMGIGTCILAGALLSFVGLGVQPPTPEWGTMIAEGRDVMRQYPMIALYPGVCLMLTVLSCNLLGDGLRDALDPRLKN